MRGVVRARGLSARAAARAALAGAAARVRRAIGPILETALTAALAWYVAHHLLGHGQPFFAPIAAAVTLSTSQVQRFARSVQMMIGVLLGIGVAELLHPLVGSDTAAIGIVLFVTLLLAVAVGVGLVGQGMMFVNQAASSAILVITLHKSGTGGERVIDALVGGGCALLVGVVLFPPDPLKEIWSAERRALGCLVEVLRTGAPEIPGAGQPPAAREQRDAAGAEGAGPAAAWELTASYALQRALGNLIQARASARSTAQVSPRRMAVRASVAREMRRSASVPLLASAVLSLVHTARELAGFAPGPAATCKAEMELLAGELAKLRDAPRPWPVEMLKTLRASPGERPGDDSLAGEGPEAAVAAAAVRRATREFAHLLDAAIAAPSTR